MHLWMEDVNDGCLATCEGTTEKISEFLVGIKPTTSVTLVGCSNLLAMRTPSELCRLTRLFFTQCPASTAGLTMYFSFNVRCI